MKDNVVQFKTMEQELEEMEEELKQELADAIREDFIDEDKVSIMVSVPGSTEGACLTIIPNVDIENYDTKMKVIAALDLAKHQLLMTFGGAYEVSDDF